MRYKELKTQTLCDIINMLKGLVAFILYVGFAACSIRY